MIFPFSSRPKNSFAGSKISLGAMGDSYYEYLIKQWIQNGKRDIRYKNLWLKAMGELMDRLVVKTKKGTLFVAEEANGVRIDKMEHLVCFVGIGFLEEEEKD